MLSNSRCFHFKEVLNQIEGLFEICIFIEIIINKCKS